jgi:multicomponent Na+:H+ antiporter subunit D
MNPWLVLPLLIPLLTAIVTVLAQRSIRTQRWVSLAGALALFLAALGLLREVWRDGMVTAQMGNWPAPFGVTVVADLFSAVMVLLAGTIGLAVACYSLASIHPDHERFGYHSLVHFLLMGVCGAFLTGDLFNLYVWFEVMLLASFVLMALGGERAQMAGAIKYVTLNLISSALFLAALGLLYGMAGTLNMADLAAKLRALGSVQPPGVITALAILFLIAFGIKAAIFPLFFWLPASYPTPPVEVSALFAGLLTKVGAYSLIRVFSLVFVQDTGFTHSLILILAGLTMLTGVLGAVAQYDMRRLLSFHIISQIGYLLMGLGLLTPLSLAGAVFFIFHVSVAKTALFLVSGIIHRTAGTYDLRRLGGLYRSQPGLAILFLLPALSLAGLPPLSGFFGKLTLIQAGLSARSPLIVGTALGVSLLTLFSMIKIWNEAFWKPGPEGAVHPPCQAMLGWLVPTAVLSALTLLIGLGAGPAMALALRAGAQLADPGIYILTVLGSAP